MDDWQPPEDYGTARLQTVVAVLAIMAVAQAVTLFGA
jgi:hypothetical protein